MKTATPSEERLEVGLLVIDPVRYEVSFAGRDIELTRTQIELLTVLAERRERVLSRAELSAAVGLRHSRSVDVLLTKLRHTLGRDFVRNVRGRGWIMEPSLLEHA